MSIIGTRPPLISETNFYELHHRARLAIKPGITGMWQVSGRSDITDFEEVVRLDKEERLATPEEQEVLSHYVGWGGIPQAFEENNGSWANEYSELKNTLTSEEYSAARASTLNAFYTEYSWNDHRNGTFR